MTTLRTPAPVTGRWRHVATATTTTFTVRNFGLNKVTGTLPVAEAWVDVDADGVPQGVTAVLDLRAVETGNARRDRDLQKPNLLDTANQPTLTFAGVPQAGPGGWTVTGTLAGRRSADVTLDVQIVSATAAQITVQGSAEIDRRALGVRAPRFLVGRRLRITVTGVFRAP